MNEDQIVAEVRRVREELSARFNHDIHAIFADLRTRQDVNDPAHPLVLDAQEWADAGDALTLREDPPECGKKKG
jgi:hypothetical protein